MNKQQKVNDYLNLLDGVSIQVKDANDALRKSELFPRHTQSARLHKKKAATDTNKLTDEVIRHIKSRGGIAYRVNSQGQYDPTKNRWRPSGMKRGLPDVFGILNGGFCGVEIKTGRDKLSEYQLQRKTEIEAAGGLFFVVSDIEQFKMEFDNAIKGIV